ncbi:tryptophan-rich sensory protein [Balneolaceae bacterium ANBcel3]|nr:tryptophan-rich sensory protein [Balneolaceae bacterium ANBcel3]
MKKGKSLLALVLSILVAQLAGWIGSLATRPNIEPWYRLLEKPVFTPPDWVFPVVWPLLYLLMAVAAWLVFREPGRGKSRFWQEGVSYESMLLRKRPSRKWVLGLYGIHLILNVLWSFIFFQWQMPGVALIHILVLLMVILLLTRLFYRSRPLAGYLMIPYIMWVTYATMLNAGIWWLN